MKYEPMLILVGCVAVTGSINYFHKAIERHGCNNSRVKGAFCIESLHLHMFSTPIDQFFRPRHFHFGTSLPFDHCCAFLFYWAHSIPADPSIIDALDVARFSGLRYATEGFSPPKNGLLTSFSNWNQLADFKAT